MNEWLVKPGLYTNTTHHLIIGSWVLIDLCHSNFQCDLGDVI